MDKYKKSVKLLVPFTLLLIQLFFELCQSNSISSVIGLQNHPFFSTGIFKPVCTGANICSYLFPIDSMSSNGYQATLGIVGIQQVLSSPSGARAQFNTYIVTKYQTQLQINVESVFMSNISSIQISYLCAQSIVKNYGFYILSYQWNIYSSLQVSNTIEISIDLTAQIGGPLIGAISPHMQIYSYITGYDVTSNYSPNIYNFKIYSLLSSSIRYNLYAQTLVSSYYMTVQNFKISTILFNLTKMGYFQKTSLTYGTLVVTSEGSYSVNFYNKTVNDFFYGISELFFYSSSLSNNTLCFQSRIDPSTDYIMFTSNSYHFDKLGFRYFMPLWRSCPNSAFPYYSYSGDLCYDDCPITRYYKNLTGIRCDACLFDCYTCTNNSTCDSCLLSDNRQEKWTILSMITTLRCVPMKGYFNLNSVHIAQPCDSNCQNCLYQATNCISCKQYFYLQTMNSTGICYPCSYKCIQCVNSTYCQNCSHLFKLSVLQDQCIVDCDILCQSCFYVQNTALTSSLPSEYLKCVLCIPGFSLHNAYPYQCTVICGDGYYIDGYQECDDGNTNDFDGCSNQCKIQLGFYCDNHNYTNVTNECYYEEVISTDQLKIQKQPFSNTLNIQFQVSTLNKDVLPFIDWTSSLQTNLGPITLFNLLITNTSKGCHVLLTFRYTQTNVDQLLQLKTLQINLNCSAKIPSSLMFMHIPLISTSCSFVSGNQMNIQFYSENLYFVSQILYYVFFIESLFCAFILFCGLFGGKIVVVQMIFAIQSVFFSLICYTDSISPSIYSMSQLNIGSVIWNPFLNQSSTNWMNMSQANQYFQDININLTLIVVPLLISSIFYLLRQTLLKNRYNLLSKGIKLMLGQFLLYGYLLLTFPLIVELFEGFFSVKNINYVSEGIGALLVLGLIVLFFLFIIHRVFFGQFRNAFYRFQISEYWINLQMLVGILASVSYVILKTFLFTNAIMILMAIIQIIFLLKIKPFIFNQTSQNRRSGILLVFTAINQITLLILKVMAYGKREANQIVLYLPALIALNISICLIYSAYCLFFKLRQSLQLIKKYKEQYTQETKQEVQKKRIEALENSLMVGISNSQRQKFKLDQFILAMNKNDIQKQWLNIDKVGKNYLKQKVKEQIREMKLSHKKDKTSYLNLNLLSSNTVQLQKKQQQENSQKMQISEQVKNKILEQNSSLIKQLQQLQSQKISKKQDLQWSNFFKQRPKQNLSYYFQAYDQI